MTTGEKLAVIESLLNRLAEDVAAQSIDIKAIRKDLDQEKSRNADLRSKGAGILIGVALAAGGVGAGLVKFSQSFMN